MILQVKIKKTHTEAVTPKYAKPGDAGMDLTAVSLEVLENGNHVYDTGLAFEIPVGYVGLVFPRSSVSKKDLLLTNSVGVIDSGYRGSVKAVFIPTDQEELNRYSPGERICQMIIMPYPAISFKEVQELSVTERSTGGFGSTGN
jgi:dUTP pyrophosphatase